MPGFLYYVPGASGKIDAAWMRTLPCGYAFDDCKSVVSRGAMSGPGESGAGSVIARPDAVKDEEIGFFSDRQTWTKMQQADIWISTASSSSPVVQPVDLARPNQIDGHLLELGDGNEWLIPVARKLKITGGDVTPYCALPMVSKLQPDGSWMPTEVRGKFKRLWEIAREYLDANANAKEENGRWFIEFEFSKMHDCACAALAANYYIGRDEVAILELLDHGIAQAILNEVVDMTTLNEFLNSKKN
jgi:hypothetical protein